MTSLKTSNNSGFSYYQRIFTANEFLAIQRQWINSDRNQNMKIHIFVSHLRKTVISTYDRFAVEGFSLVVRVTGVA
jgi:hypothetical protein